MLASPAPIVKTYDKKSEAHENQAQLWNEEGEARNEQATRFIDSMPVTTVRQDSALKAIKKLSVIQKRYLARVAEYGNLGTIIFVWNSGKYSTFASDAMKLAIILQVEGSAVKGVLQLDQTATEIKSLIVRAENLGYTVRRFND
jgi:hypothetical protein